RVVNRLDIGRRFASGEGNGWQEDEKERGDQGALHASSPGMIRWLGGWVVRWLDGQGPEQGLHVIPEAASHEPPNHLTTQPPRLLIIPSVGGPVQGSAREPGCPCRP